MRCCLRLVFSALFFVALGGDAAYAALTPPSGTINDLNTTRTFTSPPLTGVNPTGNAGAPDCSIPNTCQDYLLMVNLSAAYVLAHPTNVITVSVGWDGTNPTTDFDLYVLDPLSMADVAGPSATSSDPESISLPLTPNRNYLVRIVVYNAVNVSLNGTISVTSPSSTNVGTYITSTDVWSCNKHLVGASDLVGPPPTTFDHSNDGEPAIEFDADGKCYMGAIAGIPAGVGLWRTADACGQAYEFLGAPDAGLGGGDVDMAISPQRNLLGFQNIMVSSLTLANLTTSVSVDGGQNFTVQPISTGGAVDDRQWVTAHDANTFYLSYRQGATNPGNFLEVVRWDNGGLGTPGAGPFPVWTPPVDQLSSKSLGTMQADERPIPAGTLPLMAGPNGEGNVYHGWVENGRKVWVSRSTTFGVTWTPHLVFDGGPGASFDHFFSWVAVDAAGNVYTCFSDDSNVYYSYSTNQGDTWSTPVRVNAGGASRTCLLAEMAVGSPGKAMFTFYGTDKSSSQDPTADWKVYVVRCQNALSAVPAFEQKVVSDRMFHTGAICEQGLNCTSGRELLEDFDIEINPVDGSSFVCYAASGAGGAYITRQLSGQSSITGKTVTDRSVSCPSQPLCQVVTPLGDPCHKPGIRVVTDADADDLPPVPTADQNIQSISIVEPYNDPFGPDVLVFVFKVSSLNLASLPPNGFWRITFTTPTQQRYVRVTNCAMGGLSGDYGHFTTGSVRDGALDHFEVAADGTICMWIKKSKVDNPLPGQQLTAVNADTRDYVGQCPAGNGAFAPIDGTSSGVYTLVGNNSCAAPVAVCPPNFFGPPTMSGNPVDYPLTFRVNNPSSVARTVYVSLTETNGWLVGGTLVGPLGPIPPGGSSSVTVHLRMTADCTPNINDVLTWTATAADNSSLSSSCQTRVTCDRPVPVALTVPFTALETEGGIDLAWSSNAVDEVTAWQLYRGQNPDAPDLVTRQPIPMNQGGAFRYHDSSVTGNGPVYYRLTAIGRNGREERVGLTFVESLHLMNNSLMLVGSNPVRGQGVLQYTLATAGHVSIEVYSVTGAHVKTLIDERIMAAGAHTMSFDLKRDDGKSLGSGVYLIQIKTHGWEKSVKLIAVD